MALNRPNEDSPRKFNVSATLASQLERQLDDYGYGPETSESSAKDIVRNWALVNEEASKIKQRAKRDGRIARASARIKRVKTERHLIACFERSKECFRQKTGASR